MRRNIDTAQANDCTANSKEYEDNEKGKYDPKDLAKKIDLIAKPINVFRRRYSLVLYHQFLAIE